MVIILIIVVIYLLGPEPSNPHYQKSLPQIEVSVDDINHYVDSTENNLPLRESNDARIIWADSIGRSTEYVILYLHGFSASRMEGNPVHRNVARQFGCNLYLARLDYHGFAPSRLDSFTAEGIWQSALEQFVIAEKLGQKVIVMGTSTGATLGIMLAATFPNRVHALLNLSPNIRVRNPASFMLNGPWGFQISKLVFGGNAKRIYHKQEKAKQYWDTLYPATAVVQLQHLLETTMVDSTFREVTSPALTLFYYKNENEQDQVVNASKIPPMHESLGTAPSQKKISALTTPGDHVIGSWVKSQDYEVVEEEIITFCKEVLKM